MDDKINWPWGTQGFNDFIGNFEVIAQQIGQDVLLFLRQQSHLHVLSRPNLKEMQGNEG
jgi:hypothetical protein